jgi:hypothetical protein
MMHPGFFEQEDRLNILEKLGDPLPRLDSLVDWDAFRPLLKVTPLILTQAFFSMRPLGPCYFWWNLT